MKGEGRKGCSTLARGTYETKVGPLRAYNARRRTEMRDVAGKVGRRMRWGLRGPRQMPLSRWQLPPAPAAGSTSQQRQSSTVPSPNFLREAGFSDFHVN